VRDVAVVFTLDDGRELPGRAFDPKVLLFKRPGNVTRFGASG
jgi:hypothetical protein